MPTVYRLRIELLGSDPLIWREFSAPSAIALDELHDVIQIVMGWTDSHLHQFEHGKVRYMAPSPWGAELGEEDERGVPLNALLTRKGSSLRYEYDFGDGWEHRLTVVAVDRSGDGPATPTCLDGERACPPDDCGGIWSYNGLRRAILDPSLAKGDDGLTEMLEWIGEDFDPDRFDLARVNRQLRGEEPRWG